MSSSLGTASALCAAAGVLAHVGYFHGREHHMHGVKYIQGAFVLALTAIAALVRVGQLSATVAITRVFAFEGAFIAGALASTLFYRTFFHPLNRFPGPFGARLSNLWWSSQLTKADQYHKLVKLHEKYGNFLRIGSNDLSITHPDGPAAIYGPGSKCTKSAWYDQDSPRNSMHTSRNRQVHDKRRRVWSPAFSDKALRGYEDRIKGYGDKLIEQIAAFSGKPLDASKWFNLYSFDVMGDLAFGKSFGMLESGEEHWAIKLLNEGMEPMAMMFPPWFFIVLTQIPGLAAGYWKFINFCSQQLDDRMKTKPEIPDIMSSLLQPFEKQKPTDQEMLMMQGDSRLIIVAGSDTTAATITHIFYHIAKDPTQLEKLRKELEPHIHADGQVSHADIQNCDHLNGTINEALRLHPPVPSAVQRKTPPEGIDIAGTYIPGNCTVWCPQYVMARKEDIYPNAHAFHPERWYSETDMVKNKTSFAPFSQGVYGCIGKPLALLEIRTVVAKVLHRFDVSFAPGEDGKLLEEKTRDHFTLGLQPLRLCFTPKKA